MVETNAHQRIADLRREINYHNHRYYALDAPEITDAEYDRLMVELRRLEQEHPALVTPESPTQRVGASPAEGFTQVQHRQPMLSLANAFDEEELQAWYRRVKNLLDEADFDLTCELKIDGLAVSLSYQDGVLFQGATRGDGYAGVRCGALRARPPAGRGSAARRGGRVRVPDARDRRSDDARRIVRSCRLRGRRLSERAVDARRASG